MISVVFMYAAFAATFPLAKLAMAQTTSPMFFLALRMLCAGAGMTLYASIAQPSRPPLSREDWFDFTLAGFLAIFVAFGCEFWAIQYVPSVKVNLFYSLSPFVTALLARIAGIERLSWPKFMGLLVGFAGMLPLALRSTLSADGIWFLPTTVYDLTLLVSVTSAAYAWFIIKRLMHRGYPLAFVNGLMMLIGGAMCALAHLCLTSGNLTLVTSWPDLLWYMAALILISNVFGYTMYGMLLRKYSFTLLSFAGFMCPLFGLLYGYFFMNETLSLTYVVSLACVFVGLAIFYWDEQVSLK